MKFIVGAIMAIAVGSMLTMFGVGLWFAIEVFGFPWWIAVGPVVVVGLIVAGVIIGMRDRTKRSPDGRGTFLGGEGL